MPFSATYGKRTGVTTLKKLVQALCELYDHFRPLINGWVDANFASPKRETVLAWLSALSDICLFIGEVADD